MSNIITCPPLSEMLRDGTKEVHREAEKSSFLKALFKGKVSKKSYAQLLVGFLAIYEELEESLESYRDDPIIGPFVLPELWRAEALRKDIEYLNAIAETSVIIPISATRYVDHLRNLKKNKHVALVSHAYTRYMGDLSGGKMIGNRVRDSFGKEATNFYKFNDIDDANEFKKGYRSLLDDMPIADMHTKKMMVREARIAFNYNMDLFDNIWLIKLNDEIEEYQHKAYQLEEEAADVIRTRSDRELNDFRVTFDEAQTLLNEALEKAK